MNRSCGNREIASGTSVCACKCLFFPPSFTQWHWLSFSRAARYMWLSHVMCTALALTDEGKEPGATHIPHTHTCSHTKGVYEICASNESPMYCRPSSLKRGLLEGIVLLSLTQQSISTRFLCVTATAVAAGGLIITVVGRRVSFVTDYLWGKPNAIKASGENKQKIRDTCSPNHQISNLMWRGNKTLIRDPIHRFISSTLKPSTLM